MISLLKMIKPMSGILLILIGMLSLTISTAATYFLWILAGVLLLPPISSKNLPLKHRKALFIFFCAMLALSAGCGTPDTEDAGQNKQNQSDKSGKTAEPARENPGKKDLSKDDISIWLTAQLDGAETKTTAEDITIWAGTNQDRFNKIWRRAVLKQIKGWEDIEDYEKTAKDITKACSIYKKICGSEKETDALLQDAKTIAVLAEDNEKLQSKYSLDILSEHDSCGFNTYYIAQQLEMSYTDNLAGKLQEEVDSYQPKEYLDWLAYDVDYWMDEAVRGDTCQMVIRTKADEPFEDAGAYYLAYIETGETMTLGDSRGFQRKVPVCRMLGNGDIVENDFSQYISNIDTCFSLCQKIEHALKTGKSENSQNSMDSETDMNSSDSSNSSDYEGDSADISQYYFFYDSDRRFLNDWDFDEMDAYALCLARNEIYARHGRLFNDKEIQAYFDSMPWYEGTIPSEDFDDGVFNQYERANLEKIAALESYTDP